MANSFSYFYSAVLYIDHWIINNDTQFLEQIHECRILLSRLVVPITGVEMIFHSLSFFQSFDS